MEKKVQICAEKFATRYDPHSNPVWGSSPTTALSKVGKYGTSLGTSLFSFAIEFYIDSKYRQNVVKIDIQNR